MPSTSGGPPYNPIQAAGSIAAPLLAGISFALVVLVLQLNQRDVRWRGADLGGVPLTV